MTAEEVKKTVYVVAWNFNTGGGFNWYPTTKVADLWYEQEKENARQLADYGWKAYRFDFEVTSSDEDLITRQIDEQLDRLMKETTPYEC